MLSTTNFRKGLKIKLEGEIYYIVDFQHARTAQRRAFVRTKLKNIKTGAVLEKTFSAGETFEEPDFEEKSMQYLYSAEKEYYFMDTKTYEQISLTEDQLGDYRWYLKENAEYKVMFFEGQPLSVDLSASVVLKIASTEPAIKGDSVTNITKSATLETGLVVKVPLFVNQGEYVKIDTRTNEYIERAQKQ
ncbi:MAG: elongation factor P [candidate division Zixibacteria bacterium SM23_73]|nr:MAG: elongation factor P [candidate division Zixibacteria bacterium SM23_73]